jgi:hypothetical protein
MTLQTEFYFLSPVEVVRVTPKNIEEVAEWCGGSVHETESRRVEGRMDKYVWVPTPKSAAISWAFPGMFITKRVVITEKDELKVTFSVFRKDYFNKNYFKTVVDASAKTWERQLLEARAAHPSSGQPVVQNITINLPEGGASVVSPAALAQQIKDQVNADNAVVNIKADVDLPATEINGQGSMVQQREALAEAAVEEAVPEGKPHNEALMASEVEAAAARAERMGLGQTDPARP